MQSIALAGGEPIFLIFYISDASVGATTFLRRGLFFILSEAMVRGRGLEPPRPLRTLGPQPSLATDYSTRAYEDNTKILKIRNLTSRFRFFGECAFWRTCGENKAWLYELSSENLQFLF